LEYGVNNLGFAASIIGFSGTCTAWGICLSDWAMGDAAYLSDHAVALLNSPLAAVNWLMPGWQSPLSNHA
jgi:hypothetical protein